MQDYKIEFIKFALSRNVLRFGEFTLKSGRISPYFFNAGLFNTGADLARLGEFYAAAIEDNKLDYDVIFGPAYKGIPIGTTVSVALFNRFGVDKPVCFNRKEAKDHGEGGVLVGAPLAGQRVVIVDDVISAGTSVRESVEMLRAAGAVPVAVLIALDRMEKSGTAQDVGEFSAVQMVEKDFGIPVFAIANLADLMTYLDTQSAPELTQYQDAVKQYRAHYGV